MKKILILISISLATANILQAQDSRAQQEVGIAISNFKSIGLTYKIGQPRALWRFNTLILTGSNSTTQSDTTLLDRSGFGITLRAGREWRHKPVENVELRYGFDLQYFYNKSINSSNDTGTFRDNARESFIHRYGVNLVLGANYIFNDNLFIGIEVLPYFLMETGSTEIRNLYTGVEQEFDVTGISYGFNSSSALFIIGFRF